MKRLIILTYFLLLTFTLSAQSLVDKYLDSARYYKNQSDYTQAIRYINKALHLKPTVLQRVQINDLLADIFVKKANYYKAIHFLQKAIINITLLKEEDTTVYRLLYDHYIKIADLYEEIGELNTAIDYYINALSVAYQWDNRQKVAEAYQYIAKNYHFQGVYDKALDNYLESISIFEEINDEKGLTESLVGVAKVYKSMGLLSKSIETYLKALELAKKNGDERTQVIITSDLAYLFYNLELYDIALQFSDYATQVSDTDYLYKVYNLLFKGKIYIKLENYELAEHYLKKALDLLTFKPNLPLMAEVYVTFGELYLNQGQLDKAYLFLTRSYTIYQKLKARQKQATVYSLLGKYYFLKKDYTRAKIYYTKAYDILKESKNIEQQREVLHQLAELYSKLGNYRKANEYLTMLASIQDSLLAYNQVNVLEKEQIRQQSLEKVRHITEKLETTKRYNVLLITLLAILVGILILVAFLVFSLLRKNKILEHQKRQIETQSKIIEKQYAIYKRLSLVASHTENSIFIFDTSGKILWVNRSFLRIYSSNKKFKSYKNRTIFELSTHPKIREIVNEAITYRKTVRYLNSHIIGGKKIWLQTTITPLIEQGRVTELIAIESDVTKYKEAEQQILQQKNELEQKNKLLEEYNRMLQQQKKELSKKNQELIQQQEELKANTEILQVTIKRLRQFSIILNEVDNIIYVLDLNGKLTWVNKAFTKATGFTLIEFTKNYKKSIIEFDRHSRVEEYFYDVLRTKRPVTYTAWLINKSGQKIWLQSSLTPIINSDGNIEYIVAIETDITRLKETEEKLALQHKEIRSSIEYASRIQEAILPMKIFLEAVFDKNYFIFNKPRDIVSGDFYWAKYHNGKIFFAVADATGHGIPGAFMSVLGIMALNLVISKLNDLRPNKFLSELKEAIIHLLHQRGKEDETRDSMDIALCVFDFKERVLEYAGAYIPLYLVREKSDTKEIVVKYYPADNTTIGYDEHPNVFTTHLIRLQPNDMIYITTDGYLDQFGGERNKKFKRKRFMNMIRDIFKLSVYDQQLVVRETFENWKGANFQVDDVLVFGLRIDENLFE